MRNLLNLTFILFLLLSSHSAFSSLIINQDFKKASIFKSDNFFIADFYDGNDPFHRLVFFLPDAQIAYQANIETAYLRGTLGDKALIYDYDNKKIVLIDNLGNIEAFKILQPDIKFIGVSSGKNSFFIDGSITILSQDAGWGRTNSVLIKTDLKGNILWSREFGYGNIYSPDGTTTTITKVKSCSDDGALIKIVGPATESIVKVDSSGSIEWSLNFGFISASSEYSELEIKDFLETKNYKYILVGYIKNSQTGRSFPILISVSLDGKILSSKVFDPAGKFVSISCSAERCTALYLPEDFDALGEIVFTEDLEALSAKTFTNLTSSRELGANDLGSISGEFSVYGLHRGFNKIVIASLSEGEDSVYSFKNIKVEERSSDLNVIEYSTSLIIVKDSFEIKNSDCSFQSQPLSKAASGWWYDPEQPGTGLALEKNKSKLFSAVFAYNKKGTPEWLSFFSSSNAADLMRWTGWPWGSKYSSPVYEVIGKARIDIKDDLELEIQTNNASVSKKLKRFMTDFAQGKADPRSPANWWYSPQYDGMGFFIDIRNEKIALVWYHYNDKGEPIWYVSSGNFPLNSHIYSGSLLKFENGQCLGCLYREPEMSDTGSTITIDFDNKKASIDGISFEIKRFRF